MRIQYLVDRELDVISGGQSTGGGDVGDRLLDLIEFRLPLIAGDAILEHVPVV